MSRAQVAINECMYIQQNVCCSSNIERSHGQVPENHPITCPDVRWLRVSTTASLFLSCYHGFSTTKGNRPWLNPERIHVLAARSPVCQTFTRTHCYSWSRYCAFEWNWLYLIPHKEIQLHLHTHQSIYVALAGHSSVKSRKKRTIRNGIAHTHNSCNWA